MFVMDAGTFCWAVGYGGLGAPWEKGNNQSQASSITFLPRSSQQFRMVTFLPHLTGGETEAQKGFPNKLWAELTFRPRLF